jgi:hypothetical protein
MADPPARIVAEEDSPAATAAVAQAANEERAPVVDQNDVYHDGPPPKMMDDQQLEQQQQQHQAYNNSINFPAHPVMNHHPPLHPGVAPIALSEGCFFSPTPQPYNNNNTISNTNTTTNGNTSNFNTNKNRQHQTTDAAVATIQFYEARMRDHAVAYASAAAGAAWAAAQLATTVAAEFAAGTARPPPLLLWNSHHHHHHHPHHHPPMAWGQQQQQQQHATTGQYYSLAEMNSAPYGMVPLGPYGSCSGWDTTTTTTTTHEPQGGTPHHHNQYREESASRAAHKQRPRPPAATTTATKEEAAREPHDDNNNNNNNNSDPTITDTTNTNYYSTNDELVENEQRHRRKKRFQRLPPDDGSIPRVIAPHTTSYQQSRGKVRRRLRSDGDSSSSSGSLYRGGRGGGDATSGSGSSITRLGQKKKARSDESLVGKTAVKALYEWCSRRNHIMPSFRFQEQNNGELFECTVYLEPDVEWGRGRGWNKGAAKQDAARRALQDLCPGVRFDEGSGFVVEVPRNTNTYFCDTNMSSDREEAAKRIKHRQAALLEDLAPNLEKQLAIGSASRPLSIKSNQEQQQQQPIKRSLEPYPGTSTTSEEEDANTYYSTRGASVMSQLLFSMVQIDPHTPKAPTLSYKLTPVPNQSQAKRKASSSIRTNRPADVSRGTFTCTVQLELHGVAATNHGFDNQRGKSEEKNVVPDSQVENHISTTDSAQEPSKIEDSVEEKGKSEEKNVVPDSQVENHISTTDSAQEPSKIENSVEEKDKEEITLVGGEELGIKILKADGVGATKREARHSACARLLALLFPDCQTMVEVKTAAESAQAKYSAKKAKLAEKGDERFSGESSFAKEYKNDFEAVVVGTKVSPVQHFIEHFLDNSSCQPGAPREEEEEMGRKPASLEDNDATSVLRQLSLKKRLDTMVEKALRNSNERDEEGRCLPDELTADDVGRTVLRRAEPGDMYCIKKLFAVKKERAILEPVVLSAAKRTASHTGRSLSSSIEAENVNNNEYSSATNDDKDMFARLWVPSSVVLLLCRAIAAYEDPPLGCAVLAVDFCEERGRLLRLATMATEPHLPQERFVECLEVFARSMQSSLELKSDESAICSPTFLDSKRIVETYLSTDGMVNRAPSYSIRGSKPPLQSVREESEKSDSSVEKRPGRRPSKPSKRSRFQ